MRGRRRQAGRLHREIRGGQRRSPRTRQAPLRKRSAMNPNGKVAIVTGGASGLGAATVRALVARGAKVSVLDKSIAPGEALVKELGASVALIETDVTSEEQLGAAIQQTKQKFGGLHIAVGCA